MGNITISNGFASFNSFLIAMKTALSSPWSRHYWWSRRLSCNQCIGMALVLFAILNSLFQYNIVYSRAMYHQVHGVDRPVFGEPVAKIIHQSWVSIDTLPAKVKRPIDSWKAENPHYHYRFWSDADIPAFVQNHFPEYFVLFKRFPVDIMRSDFFRYLVVLKYGGVWSDIDTMCLKPVDTWAPITSHTVSAMVGVELDASDVILDWWSLKLQFTQWTFAAAPGHPLMRHIVDFIHKRFKDAAEIPLIVHQVTGPSIWTEAILDYLKISADIQSIHPFRFLKNPLLVGDIAIMPVTSFNPTNPQMGGKGLSDPASCSGWDRYLETRDTLIGETLHLIVYTLDRYDPRRLSLRMCLAIAICASVVLQYNVAYSRAMYHQMHGLDKPVYGKPIAKVIHQSWVSLATLPASVKQPVETWKQLNPNYDYRFWSNAEIHGFVDSNFPEFASLFKRFPVDIMRSDFFRYLVVLKHGGVWCDIDTVCLKPVDSWAPSERSVSAMIGVEMDASDVLLDWWSVKLQFTVWTFAAAPDHPLLRHVVNYIQDKYSREVNIPLDVDIVTGATIWTDAIVDYLQKTAQINSIQPYRFLKEPLVLGDVVIMPVTAFNPTNPPMGGRGVNDPASCVAHLFLGSWKKKKSQL
ncbi:hypothetical protein THRCLA_00843 [Thraustotheca clavata]|uniref:Uncharacterized protein n=1 Tax=Thraustotheca clavata TaxID=74557 RepID=A0A1W0AA88_9STRA|nr:hypothetical protein THRCLA_00843 [Thraustotheca clavata]